MQDRDHTLFYGATFSGLKDARSGLIADEFFIAQGTFQLFPSSLKYTYNTWASTGDFDKWSDSLKEFCKIYDVIPNDFLTFASQTSSFGGVELNHQQIIAGIVDTARALCNAPADADFVHAFICPEVYSMHIQFTRNNRDYIWSENSDTYNQTIQANLEIVGAAAFMGHALAIAREPEFWSEVNWILPA